MEAINPCKGINLTVLGKKIIVSNVRFHAHDFYLADVGLCGRQC